MILNTPQWFVANYEGGGVVERVLWGGVLSGG